MGTTTKTTCLRERSKESRTLDLTNDDVCFYLILLQSLRERRKTSEVTEENTTEEDSPYNRLSSVDLDKVCVIACVCVCVL